MRIGSQDHTSNRQGSGIHLSDSRNALIGVDLHDQRVLPAVTLLFDFRQTDVNRFNIRNFHDRFSFPPARRSLGPPLIPCSSPQWGEVRGCKYVSKLMKFSTKAAAFQKWPEMSPSGGNTRQSERRPGARESPSRFP